MPWEESLMRLGAQTESEYLLWAAINPPPEEDEIGQRIHRTKQGYERWIGTDRVAKPEKYETALEVYRRTATFDVWWADQTWHPGPIKRPERTISKYSQYVFAGMQIPKKISLPDSSAVGGYRTVIVTKTTGTVGENLACWQHEKLLCDEWSLDVQMNLSAAEKMVEEAGGDLTKLISEIADPFGEIDDEAA